LTETLEPRVKEPKSGPALKLSVLGVPDAIYSDRLEVSCSPVPSSLVTEL
jgi:hypothetical protein